MDAAHMSTSPAPAFSFNQVWDDAVAMLRANAGLLAAIGGAFIFLPDLLLAHFVPPPGDATTAAEFMAQMQLYFETNFIWLLLSTLINAVGAIAIYLLLLRTPRLTVGAAVLAALPILPFYFLMTIGFNLAIGLGLLLFIVPGVYLLGRLVLASPALVIESPRGPGTAFARAWQLSRGRGWQIALMVVLVYIVAGLVTFAVQAALGSVILLALGREGVGGLLSAALGSLVGAVFTIVATVVIAAIYRAVAAPVAAQRPN